MRLGWTPFGNAIYDLYATQCHQMAQRSFFLFGAQPMYDLEEFPLTLTGKSLQDMLTLRSFRGNEVFGWKVAWSDRMVYMYSSLWVVTIACWFLSRYRPWKPIRIWVFILLLVPMVVDGGTHLLSDGSGLSAGFRYDNVWLAALTNNVFAESFYKGDALGSFNSLMRLITGALFAVATAGLTFPFLHRELKRNESALAAKLNAFDRKIETALQTDTGAPEMYHDRSLDNG